MWALSSAVMWGKLIGPARGGFSALSYTENRWQPSAGRMNHATLRNVSCLECSTAWAGCPRFPGGRVRLFDTPSSSRSRGGPAWAALRLGCTPQRGELARQRIGPLRDAAGAEKNQVIAGPDQLLHHRGELPRLLEREHVVVAARAHALHQRVAIDPRNRRLAGRIDRRDDHRMGVVEAGAERLEQRCEPREAVRLHHGDDAAMSGFARGSQYGGDLDRMVRVIVDDGDAVPIAGAGEAAVDAAERGQPPPDQPLVDAQAGGPPDRGRSL